MYRKDPMLEEIHSIRKKMWKKNHYNPHSLVENIQREAKEFIEEMGYKYIEKDDYYLITPKEG